MNTPVSFEIAKLLNKKGVYVSSEKRYNKKGTFEYSKSWSVAAPTIAEVVMWLYEKHGVWITVDWSFFERQPSTNVKWAFSISNVGNRENCVVKGIELIWFNSPTEAYETAIKYTLENII